MLITHLWHKTQNMHFNYCNLLVNSHGLCSNHLYNGPFHQDISCTSVCYFYHCSHGTCDTNKQTSGTSNFNLTVVMMCQCLPLSSSYIFDIGYLLHLKHKYYIDSIAWVLYRELGAALV